MTKDVGVEPEHLSEHFGLATAEMVNEKMGQGVDRAVLLMRHSARTFDRSIHDLENRLTDHGRNLCRQFGQRLDRSLYLRGYTSPAHRCHETSEVIIDAHRALGGDGGRTRPVEGVGVFYALDQQKMWKGLQAADGLADFVGRWFAGEVANDALIPAPQAVSLIVRVLREKLAAPAQQATDRRSLDLCVSHDMTLFLVRHGVGLEPVTGPTVEFLDGLLVYEKDGCTYMCSHHGGEVTLGDLGYQ